jgi:hypothetical protein
MTVGKTSRSITAEDVFSKCSEADIAGTYFGVSRIPCKMSSPLRVDKHPSFSFYITEAGHVGYKDYATGDSGNIIKLLQQYWECSYTDVLNRLYDDIIGDKGVEIGESTSPVNKKQSVKIDYTKPDINVHIRSWKQYDLDYWGSYGITLKWLEYAKVYPISHTIITKTEEDGLPVTYTIPADKYSYVYIEKKDDIIQFKIYRPFNTDGFKWFSRMDGSVVSLWTKLPEKGDSVCVCSSLKDALCLWANVGIPSVAVQGEGYSMSDTAIGVLKSRFKHLFVCFDNDEPGIEDAIKFSNRTGFINIVLPQFDGGKDISDYYKKLSNKSKFKEDMMELFLPYIK